MEALSNFITLENLATEFGVSVRTTERWVRNETPGLPLTKVGRKRLVHRGDLEQWLTSRRTQRNVRR